MARKMISKKTRFAIFNRDSFSCRYCGKSAPNVVLEIDHLHPVSKGGSNDQENLITACFDCNRGKSTTIIDKLKLTIIGKLRFKENIEVKKKLICMECDEIGYDFYLKQNSSEYMDITCLCESCYRTLIFDAA